MRQILYISYDGMTDPLGSSQVLPYLAGLSVKGNKIHLISFEKPEAFSSRKAEIEKLVKSCGIEWYPLTYHKRPPVISTLFDIRNMWKTAKTICNTRTINIIHCRSYISALVGLAIKNKYTIPLIFDMRGFWADERVEGNIWNIKKPLYRFIYSYFKKKETELLKNSDAVISLTSKAKDIIAETHGSTVASRITVIPCCADLSHFDVSNVDRNRKNEFARELGIDPNDKVLTYVGSLGTWYMSKEMIDFFKTAHLKNIFNKFLVITRDNASSFLDYALKSGVPKEAIMIRPADRKELPSLIDLSDWSLFFIRSTFSKSASSPTKMGELLAMGKGIIANKGIGDNDLLFNKYTCGVLVDSFDTDSFEKAMKDMKSVDLTKTRKTAESYFSLEEGIRRYLKVYETLSP